jgi:serine/threonine protein kinase
MERYYIGKVLGQGGFGITYLARDLRLNRLLTIKEYFPSEQCVRLSNRTTVRPNDKERADIFEYGLEGFLNKAQAMAKLHGHPNIISITDFARENGTAYLMMSFVDGTTLREYLRKNGGRISSPLAIDLMSRVLSALREMHSKGLLHRDVSPSNIMITRQGTVKLVDFGAARSAMGQQSKSMSMILKPGYAPEEQYRSKGRQGQWTDVYSATATLYQCITGVIPPPAPDRLVEDELEAPSALVADLPPMIEKVLLTGLAVRAADRYQTVDEMQRALSGALPPIPHTNEDETMKLKTANQIPLDSSERKNGFVVGRWMWGAGALLVVIASTGWYLLSHRDAAILNPASTQSATVQMPPAPALVKPGIAKAAPAKDLPLRQPPANSTQPALETTRQEVPKPESNGAPSQSAAPRDVSEIPRSVAPVNEIPAPPGMNTFVDAATGLMWTSTDSGRDVDFEHADQFCKGLSLEGHNNWRLPHISELVALYESANSSQHPNCGLSPGYPIHVKDGIRLGCYSAWSTTRGNDVVMPSGVPPDCGHRHGTLVTPLGPHRRALLGCLIGTVEIAVAVGAGSYAILAITGLSLTAFRVSTLKTAPLELADEFICRYRGRRLHRSHQHPWHVGRLRGTLHDWLDQ